MSGLKRDKGLTLRLTNEEHMMIKMEATRRNMTITSYLLKLVEENKNK